MYGRALGKRRIDVLTTPRDLPVEKGAGALDAQLDAQLDETAPASSIEATAPAVRGCVVRESVVRESVPSRLPTPSLPPTAARPVSRRGLRVRCSIAVSLALSFAADSVVKESSVAECVVGVAASAPALLCLLAM